MEEQEITFDISKKEYAEVFNEMMKGEVKSHLGIIGVFTLVLLVSTFFEFISNHLLSNGEVIGLLIVFFYSLILGALLIFKVLIEKKLKLAETRFTSKVKIRMEEGGIFLTRNRMNIMFPLKSIRQVFELDSYFVIQTTSIPPKEKIIIPKELGSNWRKQINFMNALKVIAVNNTSYHNQKGRLYHSGYNFIWFLLLFFHHSFGGKLLLSMTSHLAFSCILPELSQNKKNLNLMIRFILSLLLFSVSYGFMGKHIFDWCMKV